MLGGIGLCFGLEHLFGGTTSVPTFARMGAVIGGVGNVAAEPWRLISSMFLHAGPLHLFFNGLVLWRLGGPFERLVGRPAYLLLIAASGIGGSLAAGLTQDGLMVGLSGALWGVMTAMAVLAWHPRSPIVPEKRGPIRRMTLQNLVLNLAVSFLPQVSLAAHLGGGLVGGLLAAVGLVQLRRPGAPPPPLWARALGAVSVLLLAAGVFLGLATGQPWQLVSQSGMVPLARAAGSGQPPPAELRVPAALPQQSVVIVEEGVDRHNVGAFPHDPMIAELLLVPMPLDSWDNLAQRGAELDALEAQLRTPDPAANLQRPSTVSLQKRPGAWVATRWSLHTDGLVELVQFKLMSGWMVRTVALVHPQADPVVSQQWVADMAGVRAPSWAVPGV